MNVGRLIVNINHTTIRRNLKFYSLEFFNKYKLLYTYILRYNFGKLEVIGREKSARRPEQFDLMRRRYPNTFRKNEVGVGAMENIPIMTVLTF